MLARHLNKYLKKYARQYPIISINGPRQSGKSTLAKIAFPNYRYISLEDPDHRNFAINDPRGFLKLYNNHVILDEAQNVPHLFSYLQTHVDARSSTGQFVLTGSQQFLLNQKISQTLAGRVALVRLLPFSLAEVLQRKPRLSWVKENKKTTITKPRYDLNHYLFTGLYPRIYDKNLDPTQFYRDYIDTYLSKDLREFTNIGDLHKFSIFLHALAARSGQRLNLTSLGNDIGVSHVTVNRWISILEASYIIQLVAPHFKNFNKRLVKTPKFYFLDTGLLCYLLKVRSVDDMVYHPARGQIFETFVFTEIYKSFANQNQDAPVYFWQDKSGNEIDFLLDLGKELIPIEAKSAQTIDDSFFKNLYYWFNLQKNTKKNGFLTYGGDDAQIRNGTKIVPWYEIS